MIETKRLILREPRKSDTSAVRRQLSKWEIAKWLAKVPHPYPTGQEEAWWARVLERQRLGFPGYFMLVSKAEPDGAPVGSIAVSPIGKGSFRIGYWLDEPQWGQGLMSEATERVVPHVFSEFEASDMVAGYYEGNEGSRHILRRLGFKEDSVSREWCEARREALTHINLILKPLKA